MLCVNLSISFMCGPSQTLAFLFVVSVLEGEKEGGVNVKGDKWRMALIRLLLLLLVIFGNMFEDYFIHLEGNGPESSTVKCNGTNFFH